MNQGRKVFEGPLASIREAQSWVLLRVDNFDGAVKVLRGSNLVVDERDGHFIALAPQVKIEQVVRCLVQAGISIHAIAPEERDLEGFYLSLMRSEKSASAASRASVAVLNS